MCREVVSIKNRIMEALALDPTVQRNWDLCSRGPRQSLVTLRNAYLYTKMRGTNAIQASSAKWFGVREEH
jgi:hypothetical protein